MKVGVFSLLATINNIMDVDIKAIALIDANFDEKGLIFVHLKKKGISDADFVHLLKQETQRVLQLNLGTSLTYLDESKLTSLSILRMRGSKWNSLTHLCLGIFDVMKNRITLETGDANTSRGSTSHK